MRFFTILIVVLAGLLPARASHAASVQPPDTLHVPFLSEVPVIDGLPEETLPVRIPTIVKKSRDGNPVTVVAYRLAYGAHFFYLAIEVEDDPIASRDRAYQNGDGFHLALTHTRPDGQPVDRFYVLGFSPADPEGAFRRQFVWYHDVDLSFKRIDEARIATRSSDGKTGIELLLPWSAVYPYHPWLGEGIGFNLCYVEAVDEVDKNEYCILDDPYLQSEQSQRRYVPLAFARPENGSAAIYSVIDRNHAFEGEAVHVTTAAFLPHKAARLTVTVATRDGETIVNHTFSLPPSLGPTQYHYSLGTEALPAGVYSVSWSSTLAEADGSTVLTILPTVDSLALTDRLNAVRDRIRPGSLTTIEFRLAHLFGLLSKATPHDPLEAALPLIREVVGDVEAAEQGIDLVATRTGIQRRAYRSEVDGTLQPYSVKVPESYDPKRAYPLLVYLHGSGVEDTGQLEGSYAPEGFIQLAPRGRGTSTVYSTNHAQDDVREAIVDVIANYAIDTTRIVLTGFSMGGYGVYRTFFEMPEQFTALAVFSGHPDLANRWLGGGHPSFLDPQNLAAFKAVPIFIFHGGRDRNCPIELTDQLANLLKEAGADVQYVVEPDAGHDRPNDNTIASYHNWLTRVLYKSENRSRPQ